MKHLRNPIGLWILVVVICASSFFLCMVYRGGLIAYENTHGAIHNKIGLVWIGFILITLYRLGMGGINLLSDQNKFHPKVGFKYTSLVILAITAVSSLGFLDKFTEFVYELDLFIITLCGVWLFCLGYSINWFKKQGYSINWFKKQWLLLKSRLRK